MTKLIKKSPRRFISILIAVVLVVGTIPVSSLLSAFAATQSIFTVEIDSSIGGNISVILTNTRNSAEIETEPVTAGAATFSNFVDSDNAYDIKITGMIGYEDYYESGVSLNGTSISFTAADFDPLDTIEVSGQITDENGTPYTGGGTVFYSGYDSGSVALAGNGSFSVTIYKNKPYDFSLTPTNPKYSPVSLGTVNSLADVTNLNAQPAIKTFSITTSAGANGTISPTESSILYGSNRSITATAISGYLIETFTVDGTPVPGAVGLETYTQTFNNMNDSHTVNVTFVAKTWEVTFTFNSDGTIKDGLSNPVTSGGKITANEGDNPSFTASANTNYHISSVVIDSLTQTGTFDNTQTTYSHTFTNISANHSVTVTFSINTYNVAVSSPENGSVTVGGSPAGFIQNISHGESLTLTLTPATGYDVEEVLLDGTPVDDYNLLTDGVSYSYVISTIAANHTVSVTFSLIETMTGDETDFYDIVTESLMSGYPIISGSTRVYNFTNDNASAAFKSKFPYNRIGINAASGNRASVQITNSTLITELYVYRPTGANRTRWVKVPMAGPIQIIIDKAAPEVANIPAMSWTNQDYTVSGTVTDEDTAATPSSGLSRVVWSKTALTKAQALAEATNTAPITGGTYSFTITTEQNNETFYVYAIDKADNVSDEKTIDVKIDKTKPEITGFTFQKIEPLVVSQVINFLTFGTFYNDAIEVIVSVQDTGISSGLKEITLYSDGVTVETKTVVGASATFKLTLADFNDNEISASVKDIAGNESVGKTKPTEVTTNSHNDMVSLKTEKPTISIVPTSETLYTNGEENWYNGNVGFTVTVSTESGGIYSVIFKVNGQIITTDKNGKAIDANFFESQTLQELFTVNTDDNPLDGENIIEVIAVNNYGNEETASLKVFIDTTNPKVVGFNIDKENGDALSQVFNFLTFGNFFNEKVKITVIADDRYGATSGIRTITLYADGEPIDGSPRSVTAIGDGTYKAEFILPESVIPEAKLLDVVLTAVATDNVTNITGKDNVNPNGVPVTPAIVNSDLKNNRLMIETVNPVIDISSSEPVFTDSDNRKWYPDDVLFTVTAKDVDSGIRSVQIKINDVDISTDADGKSVNSNFYNTETHEEVFRINTSQGTRAADGSYLIEVTVIDNAGNEYYTSDIVYKDIDNPSITGYRFIPATSDGISETSEFIEYLEYGFYFKTEFTAVIQVSDLEPSSGLDRVGYRLVSYENGTITGEAGGTQMIVDGMAVLTIPQGFKGQIFVEACDNTGNISSEETTRAFVIDDTPPEISITNNNETSYNDADGNKLYVSDMSFTVVVSDNGSGIKEIGYSQSAEKDSYNRKTIAVNNTGYSIGDILEDGWVVSEMDFNLVTKVTKTFSFSSDDNDIILTFDAADRSGNEKENVQSEKFTIDKTSPIINVSFRADEDDDQYYNQNRVADITVIDRNFDADLIKVAIENEFGSVPLFSFSETSKTEHTAVIDFDEGDYTFDVTGTDLGDHAATVNFSGGNERLFYVDKTKPAIEENFATFSNSSTEDSFNSDETVTIKVTEHNFDPALVNLRITRKDAGEAHDADGLVDATYEVGGARWEDSGDVHTISFTLSRDAVYQVEITPTDLAGNAADHRSTVVFEIDKTAPVVTAKNGIPVIDDDIEFLDIYPYSRKDDPAPTVEFDDLNIDHISYVLTVYIPDYTSSEALTVIRPVRVYLDEDNDKSGRIMGNIFTLPDFVKDGIYALELIAVDVAGNESLVNTNTYARMTTQDVLAYVLESNVAEKTGVYSFQYENGDAISKRPDNFSDIKIFVLTKKDTGIDIVLRDNNADEINTNTQAATDDSIYGVGIYNFTLEADFFKDNFQDDTDVELHLTVKNEDERIDLGKLHIDNIAPTSNLPEEFKSWSWYYGDEVRTITISDISEPIDENQCKVYDNGKEVGFEYSSADNTVVFTLEKGWHNVGMILNDMAGNANNIQEKANIHIGFFWLWVIMATSITLIIAITFAIIHYIRKKRKLEND